jgi:hypothetical protein
MHLIRTHADRSHLQVKLDCHLLLQFREVLSATYISAARALSPGAHHVVHRSSRHRRKKCRHSCGVVAIDAADAHAGGVGRTDLSASGLELLGVAADNPRDAAAAICQMEGMSVIGTAGGHYSLSTVFAAALPMPLLPPKTRTVMPLNAILLVRQLLRLNRDMHLFVGKMFRVIIGWGSRYTRSRRHPLLGQAYGT